MTNSKKIVTAKVSSRAICKASTDEYGEESIQQRKRWTSWGVLQ